MKKIYLWISLIIVVVSVNIAKNVSGIYTYHAVYMYNFIKYIEWPVSKKEGPFVIGILGASPIINELNDMAAKKKVGLRTIEVKKLSALNEAATCNILFIPENSSARLEEATENTRNKGVLIITETPGMVKKGSAINFIFVDGKLKFEINKNAASQSNLNISSELFRLGISVN